VSLHRTSPGPESQLASTQAPGVLVEMQNSFRKILKLGKQLFHILLANFIIQIADHHFGPLVVSFWPAFASRSSGKQVSLLGAIFSDLNVSSSVSSATTSSFTNGSSSFVSLFLWGSPFLGTAFFVALFRRDLLFADVFERLIYVAYGWNGSDHFARVSFIFLKESENM
jgi:hypothetical protein